MESNSTPAAAEEFQLTEFKTYVSEAIISFTSWEEKLKVKIEQYEEVEKQDLHQIDRLEKRLNTHKALKTYFDRKLEKVKNENQLLQNIIKKFKDTLREKESYLQENDSTDESLDHLSSSEERGASCGKKRKRKRKES